MKPISLLSILFLFFVLLSCSQQEKSKISLEGDWQFKIDSEDKGIEEKWFLSDFEEQVILPGSMKENGKGEIPTLKTQWTGSIYDSSFFFNPAMEKYRQDGNIKFPFWLTPNLQYKGAAWYKKTVTIPEDWDNKQISLFLERPHWQTDLWIDSIYIGSQNSLSVAHSYNITDIITPGVHQLSIRVDNRLNKINIGPDSHSVSDHTQGNWNGIVGELSIQATNKVFIEDIQIYPNVKTKSILVKIAVKNQSGTLAQGKLDLQVFTQNNQSEKIGEQKTIEINTSKESETIEVNYPLGEEMLLWDEFSPNLYELKASIKTNNTTSNSKSVSFGMRDFIVSEGGFQINGRPVFLRGTVECNTFPLTGYPPTDVSAWEHVFEKCKQSGLNHMRFHSHCPPEAAFIAADKMGFYLQPEAATWPNHSSSLGDGRPVDQYVLDETERIIKAYGNHPSFVMWAYGNEPRGRYVPFLDKSLMEWKAKDKRRVYTGASIGMSWSIIPESEFLVRSGPRGLPYKKQPNSTFDFYNKVKDEPRPYVTHEMGQWCVFPNFEEITKYTGVYQAKNFELFKEDLADKKMSDQAHDFLMASGKLQTLCYKAEIEASLRTPGLDGFQLLGLNDFPGQGTALVGLLDVFWDEKGYVSTEEISQFCGQTVPLAKMEKFVFSTNESFKAVIQLAHFGNAPLQNANCGYSITNEKGDTLNTETFVQPQVPIGNETVLGEISFDLSEIAEATKCKLEVYVNSYKNSWSFWVYPEKLPEIETDQIYYTTQLNEKAKEILKNGGKVFLNAAGKVENGKDVKAYFTPVFWNTSWFKMRPPHTLGILAQNNHPVFNDFPTDYHSDYQWWELVNGQQVMNISAFPEGFKPLVQPIDTWFLNRRLAQLFEVKVGNGMLVVSSLNTGAQQDAGIASNQLFFSIQKYMNSDQFNPENEVGLELIQELFEKKTRAGVNLYTKSGPDELKPNSNKK